jgi:hypothetical protein
VLPFIFNFAVTESCIRLYDVDDDGKLDVIFSVGRLHNTSIMEMYEGNGTRHAIEALCKRLGL